MERLLNPGFRTGTIDEARFVAAAPASGCCDRMAVEKALNVLVRIEPENEQIWAGMRLRNALNRNARYRQLLEAVGIRLIPPGKFNPASLVAARLYVRIDNAIDPRLGAHLVITEFHPIS